LAVVIGILIPFLGTVLGSGCVFFMKDKWKMEMQKILAGFSGGVMVAASVWSLLIPAINMSEEAGGGHLAFVPAVSGFLFGVLLLLLIDMVICRLQTKEQGNRAKKKEHKSSLLLLAVTLHNIPEGMAVGIAFAGMLVDNMVITLLGAFSLAIGIAIQNIPEGAIISMPLRTAGFSSRRSFLYGTLTGAVEPLGALLTIALSHYLVPLMSYLLSFASGAMIYVVVEELIPKSAGSENAKVGTIGFAIGFALMMALDVALG